MHLCIDEPSNFTFQCHRSLENNLFSITVIMTVSQYLANERVIEDFIITPNLVTYADSSKAEVKNVKIYLFREVPVEVCNNACLLLYESIIVGNLFPTKELQQK